MDLWIDLHLQDVVEFERFGQRITGFSKTSEVMFHVIKVLKTDFRFLNVIMTTALFKYFSYPQNLMSDLQIQDKPEIRDLQIQFQSVADSTATQFSLKIYSVHAICRNLPKSKPRKCLKYNEMQVTTRRPWRHSATYSHVCLFLARQPPSGPGPPHSQGF